jgi:hypothetical protein
MVIQSLSYRRSSNSSSSSSSAEKARIQALEDTQIKSVNKRTEKDIILTPADIGAEEEGASEIVRAYVDEVLAALQRAINGKQDIGNYALNSALNTAIASLQKSIDEKQPIGNYALQQALNDAIELLTASIDTKQPIGNYALKSSTRAILNIDSATVVIPSTSNVVPFTMADNITLTNNIQAGAEDGQLLTLVNLSNFWLVLPVFGSSRIIFPKDNLNLIFSSALNGWVAPGAFKGFSCRVFNSGNVSIPVGASIFTQIPFDNTRYDTGGGIMHSNTVNNSRIFAPVAGYYRAWLGLQVGNTGQFSAFIQVGGLNQAGQSLTNGGFASIGTGTFFFSAGQFVDFVGRANNNPATLVRTSAFANEAELTLESL